MIVDLRSVKYESICIYEGGLNKNNEINPKRFLRLCEMLRCAARAERNYMFLLHIVKTKKYCVCDGLIITKLKSSTLVLTRTLDY